MRFSEEDLRRQLESSMPGAAISGQAQYGMQQLLSSLAAAAENSLLEGCPVFIGRLRSNPKLVTVLGFCFNIHGWKDWIRVTQTM